eukprot:8654526-Pyramimonas_sp.AAC.1
MCQRLFDSISSRSFSPPVDPLPHRSLTTRGSRRREGSLAAVGAPPAAALAWSWRCSPPRELGCLLALALLVRPPLGPLERRVRGLRALVLLNEGLRLFLRRAASILLLLLRLRFLLTLLIPLCLLRLLLLPLILLLLLLEFILAPPARPHPPRSACAAADRMKVERPRGAG